MEPLTPKRPRILAILSWIIIIDSALGFLRSCILLALVCFTPEMKAALENNPYPYGIPPQVPIVFPILLRGTMIYCGIALLKGRMLGRTILIWSSCIAFIVFAVLIGVVPELAYRLVIPMIYIGLLYSGPVSRYLTTPKELKT